MLFCCAAPDDIFVFCVVVCLLLLSLSLFLSLFLLLLLCHAAGVPVNAFQAVGRGAGGQARDDDPHLDAGAAGTAAEASHIPVGHRRRQRGAARQGERVAADLEAEYVSVVPTPLPTAAHYV